MKTGRPLTFEQSTIEEIRILASKGMRATEISKRIGRHYQAVWQLMKRLGIQRQPRNRFPPGAANPSWLGGRYIDADGYVCLLRPEHPFARGKGYVREHRLVMEKILGRFLTAGEVVHHKDGNKLNNAPSNLQLFARNSDHLRHELTGRVPKWTEDGKKRIRQGIQRSVAARSSR